MMSFIDNLEELGVDEVRRRLQKEGLGQPGSQNYSSAQEWLRCKERELEDGLNARQEIRAEESLSISRRALWVSKYAIAVSIVAILCSIITAIFMGKM